MVFLGLVTACLRAIRPATRSPTLDTATTEGVVRAPSAFSRMCGSPPWITAIAEFVVPKSIPRIFPICFKLHSNNQRTNFKQFLIGLKNTNRHLRRTDYVFTHAIAGAEYFYNSVVFLFIRDLNFLQRLVFLRVKFLSLR